VRLILKKIFDFLTNFLIGTEEENHEEFDKLKGILR